ncbi:hypothetical protein [Chitinophaga rhizosphaerae]|uniref:hypothetical protein n=1 Tax=Chitinophaga rhizosphaerae TaxID=1864947 RepID=UPI000F808B40|nr:hypothetical protein [Chitinophaga rhizosphaerae]
MIDLPDRKIALRRSVKIGSSKSYRNALVAMDMPGSRRKRQGFAFACLMVSAGAIAAGSNTTLPVEKKANVNVITNNAGIKVGAFKQEENKYRIQKSFQMWDACGQMITVWVSAPNGTAWDTMYSVAIHHVMDCLNSNGCYQQ